MYITSNRHIGTAILILTFVLTSCVSGAAEPNQTASPSLTLYPFWQNLISTFIGALLGFIFSICLFYLINRWSKKSQRESLQKNLIKEFEFNEHYLTKLLAELKKAVEKITVNDKNMYFLGRYDGFQRLFIQAYFQQGLLYEKLTPNDINLLDTILSHMIIATAYYINEQVSQWKFGNLNQHQVLDIVSFERDTVENYINDIREIKQKLITT